MRPLFLKFPTTFFNASRHVRWRKHAAPSANGFPLAPHRQNSSSQTPNLLAIPYRLASVEFSSSKRIKEPSPFFEINRRMASNSPLCLHTGWSSVSSNPIAWRRLQRSTLSAVEGGVLSPFFNPKLRIRARSTKFPATQKIPNNKLLSRITLPQSPPCHSTGFVEIIVRADSRSFTTKWTNRQMRFSTFERDFKSRWAWKTDPMTIRSGLMANQKNIQSNSKPRRPKRNFGGDKPHPFGAE